MRGLFCIAFVASALGCSKKDSGPSCEQVVDHMLEVTKTNLPGHETTNLGSQKKAMVNSCEARHWDGEIRTCLVGAQSISEIAKCRGGKTDVFERPRRPRIPLGSGSAGSAVVHPPMGSSSAGSGSASGSGSAK